MRDLTYLVLNIDIVIFFRIQVNGHLIHLDILWNLELLNQVQMKYFLMLTNKTEKKSYYSAR